MAAIQIKLADLLEILTENPPRTAGSRAKRGNQPGLAGLSKVPGIDEAELEAISQYLQSSGPARREDLEFAFHYSGGAALYRLSLLRERGVVEQHPRGIYGLRRI